MWYYFGTQISVRGDPHETLVLHHGHANFISAWRQLSG